MKALFTSAYTALKRQVAKEFQQSAVGFWLFILISVAIGGAYGYLRQDSSVPTHKVVNSVNTTPDATDIRAELAALDIHNAANFDDYIARARKMQKLIPRMEAFYKDGDSTVAGLRRKYADRPDLLRIADIVDKLNERDKFGFQLLKEELSFAVQLGSTEKAQRQQFFDKHIRPLQEAESNVVEEEISIAEAAIKDGVPLPADVVQSLRNKRVRKSPAHPEGTPNLVQEYEQEKRK